MHVRLWARQVCTRFRAQRNLRGHAHKSLPTYFRSEHCETGGARLKHAMDQRMWHIDVYSFAANYMCACNYIILSSLRVNLRQLAQIEFPWNAFQRGAIENELKIKTVPKRSKRSRLVGTHKSIWLCIVQFSGNRQRVDSRLNNLQFHWLYRIVSHGIVLRVRV